MVTQGASVDLFGEKRIRIEGNPKLEGIANHILDLYGRKPEILNGATIGEINRKVTLAVWFDDGLQQRLTSDNPVQEFINWFMDKKQCVNEEEVARALRYLSEKDYVRLPKVAIEVAEQHRKRIARSLHH